mgnify:CR=1 FL=1
MGLYYKIYAVLMNGTPKYIDRKDTLEEVQMVLDNLDSETYYQYMVVEHSIINNSDFPVAMGFLDYNENKPKKRTR